MKQVTRQRPQLVVVALVLAALAFGWIVFVSASQQRSAERFAAEAPDIDAWRAGIALGLSDEGASAWSRYRATAERLEAAERTLLADGHLECHIGFVGMSLEEFAERHPPHWRSADEDARLDPHLRALIESGGR